MGLKKWREYDPCKDAGDVSWYGWNVETDRNIFKALISQYRSSDYLLFLLYWIAGSGEWNYRTKPNL